MHEEVTLDELIDRGPPWLRVAANEIGVHEVRGSRHNQRIVQYHSATSLGASDDETAWCSSFANWVLKQVDIAGTNSATARSWEKWGVASAKTLGAIVVMQRGGSSWMGHVGFLIRWTDDKVCIIGGNQGDAVSEKWFPIESVLAFRMPKTPANSRTVQATAVAAASATGSEATKTVASMPLQSPEPAQVPTEPGLLKSVLGFDVGMSDITAFMHTIAVPLQLLFGTLLFASLAVILYERLKKMREGTTG